nr:MAG TPA: hypothetical protein [Herelleviridae sp.]
MFFWLKEHFYYDSVKSTYLRHLVSSFVLYLHYILLVFNCQ